MIVTICGSTKFYAQMLEAATYLESLGHEVLLPHLEFGDFHVVRDTNRSEWKKLKPAFMKDHFEKMVRSDVVLVLNYDKGDYANYIGGNTLIDIAIAYEHNKPIFLLNPVPLGLSYSDEIEVMEPVVLDGDVQNFAEHTRRMMPTATG